MNTTPTGAETEAQKMLLQIVDSASIENQHYLLYELTRRFFNDVKNGEFSKDNEDDLQFLKAFNRLSQAALDRTNKLLGNDSNLDFVSSTRLKSLHERVDQLEKDSKRFVVLKDKRYDELEERIASAEKELGKNGNERLALSNKIALMKRKQDELSSITSKVHAASQELVDRGNSLLEQLGSMKEEFFGETVRPFSNRVSRMEWEVGQLTYFSRVGYRALKKLLKIADELDSQNGFTKVIDLLEKANPNKWSGQRLQSAKDRIEAATERAPSAKKETKRESRAEWEVGRINLNPPREHTVSRVIYDFVKERGIANIDQISGLVGDRDADDRRRTVSNLQGLYRRGFFARTSDKSGVYRITTSADQTTDQKKNSQ